MLTTNEAMITANKSVYGLDDWWCICHELAEATIERVGRGEKVTVWPVGDGETLKPIIELKFQGQKEEIEWGFHSAALIDGMIHDPWLDPEKPIEQKEWLVRMFGENVYVEVVNEAADETVFVGQTQGAYILALHI